jgi:SAM-dependent methyltransferase
MPSVDSYYRSGRYLREKHRLAGDKFVRWALGLIPSWTAAAILDAGGGWGRFTWPLVDDYGVDARQIVLADRSEGMLQTAVEEANSRSMTLCLSVCDIQAFPFRSRQFDIVMANHVLYHLPDIPQGVRELARVLKKDGRLLATTNSDRIVATIIALHYQALEILGIPFTPKEPSPFSMENGGVYLAERFLRVEPFYYEDEQQIYDASELRAAYETIGRYRLTLARDDVPERAKRELPQVVERLAQAIIDRDGVLRSPSLMGAFVCAEPK